jgi:hypothetical protein
MLFCISYAFSQVLLRLFIILLKRLTVSIFHAYLHTSPKTLTVGFLSLIRLAVDYLHACRQKGLPSFI